MYTCVVGEPSRGKHENKNLEIRGEIGRKESKEKWKNVKKNI